jgi:RNA polymerase sigma factor (sigma-70 family)
MAVMQTGATDTEIINLVLQGNQPAFALLVDRYQNYVFTLVLRMIGNRENAEELSQDVFVKAYRSLADFRGEAKFSTWLYTIVRTSCLSFLRKKRVQTQPLNLDQTPSDGDPNSRHSGWSTPLAERRSRQYMVQQGIRLLGPDDAQVISLFYQAEQSLEEIGTILGVEPDTAKVKLFRARQRLKEKMEKYFGQEVKELFS